MKRLYIPAKRANGQKWSAGPYVRVGERSLWNKLFKKFSWELEQGQNYPEGVALNKKQIETAAWNCAYHAIWLLREQ